MDRAIKEGGNMIKSDNQLLKEIMKRKWENFLYVAKNLLVIWGLIFLSAFFLYLGSRG